MHTIIAAGARGELRIVDGTARLGDVRAVDSTALRRLLATAESTAVQQEAFKVLGPIGRDTWGDYRLVVESDGLPPFPGEPTNPDWMAEVWQDAGYKTSIQYCSAVDEHPVVHDRRAPPSDVRLIDWATCGDDLLLHQLHSMSETAFAGAPLFERLPAEDFVARFSKILGGAARLHSYVAFRDDLAMGYLLGYPDGMGGHVLKTLVSMSPGLGTHLVDRFYADAVAAGSGRVVHALMHDDNASVRMSRKFDARVFRRYALLEKDLSA